MTAVDTSVLIAIAKGESDAASWVRLLAAIRQETDLVICEVVAAEYYAFLLDDLEFERTIRVFGIVFAPSLMKTARLAGRLFNAYRKEGGPREHLIPDFLVGAHASQQAHQLASKDRGFLRRYFPRLKVIHP